MGAVLFLSTFSDNHEFRADPYAAHLPGGKNANGEHGTGGRSKNGECDRETGVSFVCLVRLIVLSLIISSIASFIVRQRLKIVYFFLTKGVKRKFDVLPRPAVPKETPVNEGTSQPLLPALKSLIVTFDCRKARLPREVLR